MGFLIGTEVMISHADERGPMAEDYGLVVGSTSKNPDDPKAWPVVLMPESDIERWPRIDYWANGAKRQNATGAPIVAVEPRRLRPAYPWDRTWRCKACATGTGEHVCAEQAA